jgi:hypothetical protein
LLPDSGHFFFLPDRSKKFRAVVKCPERRVRLEEEEEERKAAKTEQRLKVWHFADAAI